MATINMNQFFADAMAKNPNNVESWKAEFNNMVESLKKAKISHCEAIYGTFEEFYPSVQYIRLDALKSENWPNGIKENSVYVTFKVNLIEKKIEIHSCGHVWISDADKELYERDYYMAMHSMTQICKRNGGKVMRKSSYKSVENATEKIIKAYNAIMKEVVDYTEGYPYKKGVKALKSA